MTQTALRTLRPELGRLWLRRAFRDWPGPAERWLDLATGRIRRGGGATTLPSAAGVDGAGGLLYVPPVPPRLAPARDALVAELAGRGVPVLLQIAIGEAPGADAAADSGDAAPEAVAVDLTTALLAGDHEPLSSIAAGAVALWPLVAGVTDDEALWDAGCARLARAGAACVQAVAPLLEPGERRELASGLTEESGYTRVFHSRGGDERRFAAIAARHRLAAVFRRRPRAGDRQSRNQSLAELLALGGELWLRLGRSETQAQDLFRASRWVDDTTVDVRALQREGNLEVAGALRPEPVAGIVAEWAGAGGSATVERWIVEYVEPPAAP